MSIVVMQQWVQEIGQRIGAPSLSLTGHTCTLTGAHCDLIIEYEESTDSAHLWSPVATLPADLDTVDYADLYEALLAENLTGSSTAGARFAFDAAKNRILLCESLPVREEYGEAFHTLVPIMLKLSEQWHARFNDTEA